MFWEKRRQLSLPRPAIKKPEPREVTDADIGMSPEELEEYTQLIQAVGCHLPTVLRRAILFFLKTQKILIYNPQEVFGFLNLRPRKEVPDKVIPDDSPEDASIYREWVWKALRPRDKIDGFKFGGESFSYQYGGFYSSFNPYAREIPLIDLRTIASLKKNFSDQSEDRIHFFVSDVYKAEERFAGDPHFVMVYQLEIGGIIFGFWEEGKSSTVPQAKEA
ncbi:MAG: hypothetical protein HYW89_01085 [Candidatus Sungiibacteriota bacterium]|uniref:Uncharacterized protein n=1 Tax=Candidatus Sungiibacteriota bacterium TaxID=2750080 RepID=A0A7T5URH1_9BACT|nr:MAG: hypothetical protein HYW89_01085 [Candidatus Sungbacteria bacterium]